MRHSIHAIFYDAIDAHEAAGRFDEALSLLYQAQRWSPLDPTMWLRLGVLSYRVTNREWLTERGLEGGPLADMGAVNAELYLRRGLELAPAADEARFAFWLGWIRWALYQDRAGAMEALERALQLEPSHAYAHAALGRLALEAGASETACAHFATAVAALPESPRLHYDLGAALVRREAFEEARAAFALAAACRGWPRPTNAIEATLHEAFHGEPEAIATLVRRHYADV